MNRENRVRLRNVRDTLASMAVELTAILGETVTEKDEEVTMPVNWTTAEDSTPSPAVYIAQLRDMTTLKGVSIVGQIDTVFAVKSYVKKDDSPGLVYRIVLKDDTSDITVVTFDEMATKLKQYPVGTYLRITNAWQIKKNKHGIPELHLGNFAKIEVIE